MARAAHLNGVRKAVVTPHIHPGRYQNDLHSIRRAAAAFADELKRQGIPLELGFAAEVRIGPEIMDVVQNGDMPYVGELDGYHILLLEFPHSHIPPGSDKMTEWLLSNRVRPMIAHPERNKDVILAISTRSCRSSRWDVSCKSPRARWRAHSARRQCKEPISCSSAAG